MPRISRFGSLPCPGHRRPTLFALAAAIPFLLTTIAIAADAVPDKSAAQNRFFFTSQGKTAIVNADGSRLSYFNFDVPGQATWQPGSIFPDGNRVVFLSMEPRRDGPGKPFEEYY